VEDDPDWRGMGRRYAGSAFVAGAGSKGRMDMAEILNRTLGRLSAWNWIPYTVIAVVFAWVAWDHTAPVVVAKGELVSREPDNVVIRLAGEKKRECRYVGIQAYSKMQDDTLRDASIRRVDQMANENTRPLGKFDMGVWDIRPTTGATAVEVYVQHSCRAGDLRSTKMAEVKLP